MSKSPSLELDKEMFNNDYEVRIDKRWNDYIISVEETWKSFTISRMEIVETLEDICAEQWLWCQINWEDILITWINWKEESLITINDFILLSINAIREAEKHS